MSEIIRPDSIAPHDEFHSSLGLFMLMFASIENLFHDLLCTLSGVTDTVAKIIFPNLPVKSVTVYLWQLVEVCDEPESTKGYLYDILDQFDSLATMRNDLAHQFHHTESEFFSDSAYRSKIKSLNLKRMSYEDALVKAKEYNVKVLDEASEDLDAMFHRIGLIISSIMTKQPIRHEFEPWGPFDYTWKCKLPGHSKRKRPKRRSHTALKK